MSAHELSVHLSVLPWEGWSTNKNLFSHIQLILSHRMLIVEARRDSPYHVTPSWDINIFPISEVCDLEESPPLHSTPLLPSLSLSLSPHTDGATVDLDLLRA